MMKKMIATAVVLAMLAASLVGFSMSASAEPAGNVTVSIDNMLNALDSVQDTLLTKTAQQRADMYNFIRAYLSTDEGLDAVIALVDDPTLPITNSARVLEFLNMLTDAGIQPNTVSFMLTLLKCIPAEDRAGALTDLKMRKEFEGALTAEQQQAVTYLYENFLAGGFRDMAEESHRITESVILQFVSHVNKNNAFVVTDDVVGGNNFALYTVSSSFNTRVQSFMKAKYPAVNGRTWSTTAELLTILIDSVNDATTLTTEDKAHLKTAFSVSGIDTYVKKTVEPSASPSPSPGSSSTPGGYVPPGGSGKSPSPSASTSPSTPPTQPPLLVPIKTDGEIPAPPAATGSIAPDIEKHWAKDYMALLAQKDILRGDANGNMNPDMGITRQDFAVMLVRLLGIEDRVSSKPLNFTDVNEFADYAKNACAVLVELNIYRGYGDGTFRPQRILNREEIAALLSRSTAYAVPNVQIPFSDAGRISAWAADDVKKQYGLGIMLGREDGSFGPQDSITRAEISAMVYRIMYICDIL